MMACEVWLADQFLTDQGYTVTVRADGRRTATRGGVTRLLAGVCGHDPADCPPLVPTAERRAAA